MTAKYQEPYFSRTARSGCQRVAVTGRQAQVDGWGGASIWRWDGPGVAYEFIEHHGMETDDYYCGCKGWD